MTAASARDLSVDAEPADLLQRMNLERVALACRSWSTMLVASIAVGALLAGQAQHGYPRSVAWGWFALLIVVSLGRWWLHYSFHSQPRVTAEAPRWRVRIIVAAALTGCVWSAPGALLLPANGDDQLFIGGIILAIAAAGVASFSAVRFAYTAFLVPFLLPVAVNQLSLGGSGLRTGVALLLFMVIMLGIAVRSHESFSRMLRLSMENEALARRLAREMSIAEQINGDLQRQVRERERAEIGLRSAKAEAENANRAKSQFLANMSHEVRTPLNAILGMTELLRRTTLSERQRKFADTVFNAGSKLLSIINDILDLARVEAGSLRLADVEFAPRILVAEVIDLMSAQASGRGLSLTQSVASGVPQSLRGDPDRLRQVLVNLVANAIKFTREGSVHIAIDAGAANCVNDHGQSLRWSVTDTGIGIDAREQAHLFQPFSQVDNSTTRRFGGTGLGLAICRQLVSAMGGQIGVTSQLGAGSTFWFEIALEVEAAPTFIPASRPSSAIASCHAHVLVAEDNETNCELLREMLELAGCTVSVAHTGAEALQKLSQESFDVALMDWHMPELDGLEATRQLRARGVRARHGGRALPVIALTASTMAGDRETCIDAGMDDYLAKPFTYQNLTETLSRWVVARARPVQPAARMQHAAS